MTDAVQHSSHYPRGVLDWFAAAELDIAARQEHDRSSQFPNPHFKGHPRSRGGLREHQGPTFVSQRMRSVRTSVCLDRVAEKDDALNFVATQRLNGKKIFHEVTGKPSEAGIKNRAEVRHA